MRTRPPTSPAPRPGATRLYSVGRRGRALAVPLDGDAPIARRTHAAGSLRAQAAGGATVGPDPRFMAAARDAFADMSIDGLITAEVGGVSPVYRRPQRTDGFPWSRRC